jgi:hypothetical protein
MVGVIGGVFVCMGYALKVTTAAVSAFVDNSDDEIPPAVASASALKTKFSGECVWVAFLYLEECGRGRVRSGEGRWGAGSMAFGGRIKTGC